MASWQIKERDHWIELLEPEKDRVISPLEMFPDVNFAVQQVSAQKAVFQATLPTGVIVTKTIALLTQPPFHSLSVVFSNPTEKDQTVETALPWGNGIDKHIVGAPYDLKAESLVKAETRAVALTDVFKFWKPGLIFQRTVDLTDAVGIFVGRRRQQSFPGDDHRRRRKNRRRESGGRSCASAARVDSDSNQFKTRRRGVVCV